MEVSQAVLQLDPNNAAAHEYLGESLMGLKQKAEGRKELELAIRLDPNGIAGREARKTLAKNP